MTTPPAAPPTSSSRTVDDTTGANPWATGLTLFAGLMLVLTGVNQALAGLAGIIGDEIYFTVDDYVYDLDLTAWGWIHLVVGVVLLVAGFSVVRGKDWAKFTAIGLASLSLIANFLFVPYYPIWALTMVALNIAVIWALASTVGRQRY